MTDSEILQTICSSELPQKIKAHCRLQLQKGTDSSLWRALREDSARTISGMGGLLSAIGKILALEPAQLLDAADFQSQDARPERLEAAFAELRAVGFLHNQGFLNLRLLKAKNGAKRADIVGSKDGVLYSFDVWCSSSLFERAIEPITILDDPDHPRESNTTLAPILISKYAEKTSQISATCAEFTCARHGLIFVVNSPDAVRFNNSDDFIQCLRSIFTALGQPVNWHFGIVTGTQNGDVIFPLWPQEPNS